MPTISDAELLRRAKQLQALQHPCQLCPRICGTRRTDGQTGHCGETARLRVAVTCPHGGEEPPLSGRHGAGTVFVVGCNMQCCFCQNHQISQPTRVEPDWEVTPGALGRRLLALQEAGCHNVEWVSPTQHLPALLESLWHARRLGLTLPVVFNSNGYERIEILRLLDGIVDVYLPDAKYSDDALARRLSGTPGYVEVNRAALQEMQRQVGDLELDSAGIARRGLIVRHLVLPGELDNTRGVLGWLAGNLGPQVHVSLMAQYRPAHHARRATDGRQLQRRITAREYRRAIDALEQAGLVNGWIQEPDTRRDFLPDFHRARPFCAPARDAAS